MKKLLLLSALLIFACSSDLFAQQLDYEELLVEHLINKLSRDNSLNDMIKINDTEQNTVSYVMSDGSEMIKRTSNYIRLYELDEDGETMLQYSYQLDNVITIKGDLNNDNIDEIILQINAFGGGNVDWGETYIVEDNLLTNFTFYDNYGNNIIGNGYGSYFKINKIENQKLYADYGVMKGDKWDWDRKKIVGELINGKMTQIDAPLVTVLDGNSYDYLTYFGALVKVFDQEWTVENAKMVTYRDGTPIPQVTDNTAWQNLTTGAWSYYDNDPKMPRLYNWYAVMGIHDTDPNTPNKEFAPEGWHVPTDAEWTTLEEYLIANSYNYDGTYQVQSENKIAKAMAFTSGWNSSTQPGAAGNDQSLNNSSGFNVFPKGYRFNGGSFNDEGGLAIFWSSTESSANNAWNRNLSNYNSSLYRSTSNKRFGFSVRFVRD